MRIVGLSGSLRSGSHNRLLLTELRRLAPAGVDIEIRDIGGLAFFEPSLEAAGATAEVRELTAAVRAADAVVIATPEFNWSIPGVLGNALDWLSRPPGASPLTGKPTAVMGASPGRSGTRRAQGVLGQVLEHLRADVVRPPLLVPQAGDRLAGGVADAQLEAALRQVLADLAVARRAAVAA